MGIEDGLGGVEKYNAVHGRKDLLNHGAQAGVHDLGQQLPLLHPGADLRFAQEEARGIALDVYHGMPLKELGHIASVADTIQDAVFAEKTQHRFHDLQRAGGIRGL